MYWGHQLVSSIGESIGRIWKRWPGYNEECNLDHEYFGLDGKTNIRIYQVVYNNINMSDLSISIIK